MEARRPDLVGDCPRLSVVVRGRRLDGLDRLGPHGTGIADGRAEEPMRADAVTYLVCSLGRSAAPLAVATKGAAIYLAIDLSTRRRTR